MSIATQDTCIRTDREVDRAHPYSVHALGPVWGSVCAELQAHVMRLFSNRVIGKENCQGERKLARKSRLSPVWITGAARTHDSHGTLCMAFGGPNLERRPLSLIAQSANQSPTIHHVGNFFPCRASLDIRWIIRTRSTRCSLAQWAQHFNSWSLARPYYPYWACFHVELGDIFVGIRTFSKELSIYASFSFLTVSVLLEWMRAITFSAKSCIRSSQFPG